MEIRCSWAEKNELEKQYHDHEWGVPVFDDTKLFEMLLLESMQAGLSWSTILKKRATLASAYDGWDYHKIAEYKNEKIQELLADPGIIRNKLKIKAAITNAQQFMVIQKEFKTFSNYIWQFVNHQPIVNSWESMAEIPSSTPLSDTISKNLKKRGFKFLGTTTVYAFLQSTGIVNDHINSCFCKTKKPL